MPVTAKEVEGYHRGTNEVDQEIAVLESSFLSK